MSDATSGFVRQQISDGLMTVWLDRPPVNVLHLESIVELEAVIAAAAGEPEVRALLLTGAGQRAFCAGVAVEDHGPPRGDAAGAAMLKLLNTLRGFPLPTAAALNGVTLGGGCELALACDMMLAAPHARIGQPEIKLAALPIFAMSQLQGRLPANLIAELVMGGEPMEAADAHRLGLVNRIFAQADFMAECESFMRRFTRLSRPVLVLAKQGLIQARRDPFASDVEALWQRCHAPLEALEDFAEGLAAFSEKRPPSWRHR